MPKKDKKMSKRGRKLIVKSWEEILKLPENELKKETRRLASVVNQRLYRLEQIGAEGSPSYITFKKYNKKQTRARVGGTVNDMRSTYKNLMSFLDNATSTITGYREYKETMIERIGFDSEDPDIEHFFETYERLIADKDISFYFNNNVFGSGYIQTVLREEYDKAPNLSPGWLKNRVIKRLDKEYFRNISEDFENQAEENDILRNTIMEWK